MHTKIFSYITAILLATAHFFITFDLQAAEIGEETRQLTYNIGGDLYLNPDVEEDSELVHPVTGEKIILTIEDTPFNNAVALAIAPDNKGIFVAWKDFFAHFSSYEKTSEGKINTLKNHQNKVIANTAHCMSMPLFSADGKKAVVYQHYETLQKTTHKNFLFFTLENQPTNACYQPMMQNQSKDFDALLLGEVEDNAQPLVYAALSNKGELVSIIGYQDHSKRKQIACGKWQSGRVVMRKRQHHIQEADHQWLNNLVHIACNEDNPQQKFEFWMLPKEQTRWGKKFGSITIYTASWDQLFQGKFFDITLAPQRTIALDLSSIGNVKDIIRLYKVHSKSSQDTYAVTYLTHEDTIQATILIHQKPEPLILPPTTADKPPTKFYVVILITTVCVCIIPYKKMQRNRRVKPTDSLSQINKNVFSQPTTRNSTKGTQDKIII